MKKYAYIVDLNERGEFKARVTVSDGTDPHNGVEIFEIGEYVNNIHDLIDSGFMADYADTEGLSEFLIFVGVIDHEIELVFL